MPYDINMLICCAVLCTVSNVCSDLTLVNADTVDGHTVDHLSDAVHVAGQGHQGEIEGAGRTINTSRDFMCIFI